MTVRPMGTSTPWIPDPDLIELTRGGDAAAYSVLFERHREAAWRLARQLARTPSDADDLVAEAFERVLNQLRQGKGPDVAFRAYLLTTLRHAHFRHHRAERVTVPTGDALVLDQPVEDPDRVLASFDNAAAARAFGALPERWQMILWHLEVEGQRPAQVAELLGMKPNAVSALAYRAREALRQAYLLEHIAQARDAAHAAILEQLPALARRKLGRRDTQKVRRHLAGCASCSAAYAEISEMSTRLSAFIAPVILGAGAATPYLQSAPATTLTALHHPVELARHWIHHGPARSVVLHKLAVGVAASLASGVLAGTGWVIYAEPGYGSSHVRAADRGATTADRLGGRPWAGAGGAAPTAVPSARPGPTAAPPLSAASTTPSPPASSSPIPREAESMDATGPSTDMSSSHSTRPHPDPKPETDTQPATDPAPPSPAPSRGSTAPADVPISASFETEPSGLSVTAVAHADGGTGHYVYSWRFGDGATASGMRSSHTYASNGTYTVSLTVSGLRGARTVTRSVSVSEPAAPAQSVDFRVRQHVGSISAVADTRCDQGHERATTCSWSFGDGSTGQGRRVHHRYDEPGRYLLRLTVTGGGATSSRAVTVRTSGAGD